MAKKIKLNYHFARNRVVNESNIAIEREKNKETQNLR
jgi:hypothetical protein